MNENYTDIPNDEYLIWEMTEAKPQMAGGKTHE